MLQHLNTLIGFAAVFAILSLLVTGVTQVIRGLGKLTTRTLIERLLRLFGELEDPRRFVAAILCHPSLEGERGTELYRTLTDPRTDPREPAGRQRIDACVAVVLGCGPQATFWRRLWPWSRTVDLDKQAVKDIGQSVYEAIGHLVDREVEKPAEPEGPAPQHWAWRLKETLDRTDAQRLQALAPETDAPGAGHRAPGPRLSSAVAPFRGRMWMLAASAFPEAEGNVPPLKTYVAAFHDKAQASASDAFTWRIRWVTVAVSAVMVAILHLDAIAVWDRAAHADSSTIAALAQEAQKQELVKPGSAVATEAAVETITKNVTERASVLPGPRDWHPMGVTDVLGLLLAVAALCLGAPFWFELLKAGIQLRSAFYRDKKE
jgi:hypothetical protein